MSTIPSSNAGFAGESNQFRRPLQKNGTQSGQSPHGNTLVQQGAGSASPFASVMAEQQGMQGKPLVKADEAPKVQQGLQQSSDSTLRMQRANEDREKMQALENISQNVGKNDSLLDVARNDVTMRNLRSAMGSFQLNAPVTPMADSIKAQALAMQHTRIGQSAPKQITLGAQVKPLTMENTGIGKLSQQFESGSQGISAIGYDRVGGTSYGKYQIASRVGSMDNFLNFLDKNAPDLAEKLRAAGPSNTGSRNGTMPNVWRQIASEEPSRFEALQEKFIYDSHYKPAVNALRQRSSLDGDSFSPAMQEVLFSTAVQHGPTGAARIFSNAAAQSGEMNDAKFDERLIGNIYAIRSEQFGASTPAIQQSARNRMHREKDLALAMLAKDTSNLA